MWFRCASSCAAKSALAQIEIDLLVGAASGSSHSRNRSGQWGFIAVTIRGGSLRPERVMGIKDVFNQNGCAEV